MPGDIFLPLEHTLFYAGISHTESMAVCGNFTHVKKMYLPRKKIKNLTKDFDPTFFETLAFVKSMFCSGE